MKCILVGLDVLKFWEEIQSEEKLEQNETT